MRYHRLRWVAFSVFVISTTLNYLDRTLLTVLAPLVMEDLTLNQVGFGWLLSAFSLTYAATSLLAGWFLDRAGVNRTITVAIGWWSGATTSTGLVSSLSGLVLCRSALGIGESAGVPAVGKLNGLYLKPEERALGAAVNGVGIAAGSAIAPLFVGMATAHSWRTPFIVTGFFGFLWIPIWLLVSRFIPSAAQNDAVTPSSARRERSGFQLLLQRPLILLMIVNVLWMSGYTLWFNWTTLYLTHVYHLALQDTAALVWIPFVSSNLGGFFGGWLSMRWMKRKVQPVRARQRAVWVSAVGSLSAFFLFLAPNAWWATAIIAFSAFFVLAGSVNIYALPIDIYGAENAGFTVSALTFAYGVLQAIVSPMIGWLGDHGLYHQVVWLVTIPAVLSSIVLLGCSPNSRSITVERDTQ